MKKHGKTQRVQKGSPVYSYTSQCCNAPATKPPCLYLGMKSKEAGTQGLGSWRCTGCHKPCKCTRKKNSLDKASDVVVDLQLT
jgi:hypothetical protein